MIRAELKAKAKGQIKGNIGILFLIGVVMTLVLVPFTAIMAPSLMRVLEGLQTFVVTQNPADIIMPGIGYWAGLAGIFLITPALSLGIYKIYLALAKGNKPTIGGLFKGFPFFGKALWLSILVGFFAALWSLLFVIPGIIKLYSYSQAFFILAENPKMSAREALIKSKRIMDGNKGKLFVLELSFILWVLLGIVTAGIALIWVVPYMMATFTNFYKTVNGEPVEVKAVSAKETPAVKASVVKETPVVEATVAEEVPVVEDVAVAETVEVVAGEVVEAESAE